MLKRIFGKKDPSPTQIRQVEAVCPHAVLVAAWDKPEDMGREEKAARFTCESCHQEFMLVEAQALRKMEADRIGKSCSEAPSKPQ